MKTKIRVLPRLIILFAITPFIVNAGEDDNLSKPSVSSGDSSGHQTPDSSYHLDKEEAEARSRSLAEREREKEISNILYKWGVDSSGLRRKPL